MRVLQLSDIHLRGDNRLSFRVVDTRHCLEVMVAHLKSLEQQPDCIVITGDLADNGDPGAYRILRETLVFPGIPIYALPGNHDHRDRMREILPEWCPVTTEDMEPYICYAQDVGPFQLVAIDTMQPGSHSGHCHPQVATWLERVLAKRPDMPTLLFMHHPPFLTGLGVMDEPFENQDILAGIIRKNPQTRLCCGHMHRTIMTQWMGCVAMTAPSVSMQIELDLSKSGGDEFRMETPGYLLHHWHEGACNTHVCQIATQASFAGPYPFTDSVNPVE